MVPKGIMKVENKMALFPKLSRLTMLLLGLFLFLCFIETGFSVEGAVSYGIFGAVGRWLSGGDDPGKARKLQLKMAEKGFKEVEKAEKKAPISAGEMQSAATVGEAAGAAGAAQLAQGGTGLGSGFNPASAQAAANAAATQAAPQTASMINAIGDAKQKALQRKLAAAVQTGESAWQQEEAQASRGQGFVGSILGGIGGAFQGVGL